MALFFLKKYLLAIFRAHRIFITVPNMKTLFVFFEKILQCIVVFGLAIGSRVRYTEWVLSCVPFFCDPIGL